MATTSEKVPLLSIETRKWPAPIPSPDPPASCARWRDGLMGLVRVLVLDVLSTSQ
jgi:hypothetical protein